MLHMNKLCCGRQGPLPAATALAANGWYLPPASPLKMQPSLAPLAVREALHPAAPDARATEGMLQSFSLISSQIALYMSVHVAPYISLHVCCIGRLLPRTLGWIVACQYVRVCLLAPWCCSRGRETSVFVALCWSGAGLQPFPPPAAQRALSRSQRRGPRGPTARASAKRPCPAAYRHQVCTPLMSHDPHQSLSPYSFHS